MHSVFILQHLHVLPGGEEDVKFLGAYRSSVEAEEAVARFNVKPGFRDFPNVVSSTAGDQMEGFYIEEYQLDQDHWSEGYETSQTYEEIVSCEAPEEEGIVHIKVVALPYNDPVEFNTAEARTFTEKILAAVEEIESKWK